MIDGERMSDDSMALSRAVEDLREASERIAECEQTIQKLQTAFAELVGSNNPSELRGMAEAISATSESSEEKGAVLGAIRTLLWALEREAKQG